MDSTTKKKDRMEEINQDGRFRAELLLQVWQQFVLPSLLSFLGDLTFGIRTRARARVASVCVCACVRARATVCVAFAQRQLQLL
jgi:hypothetical protein